MKKNSTTADTHTPVTTIKNNTGKEDPGKKTVKYRKHNKVVLAGGIVATVILVVGIAAAAYISSLTNLVKEPEFTGDPSMNESDIFESDDMIDLTEETETETETNETGETVVVVKPGGTDPNTGETMPTATAGPSELEIIEKEQESAVQSTPVAANKNVYNILLIGTDNRGNEVNGRSDTMMILSVNKKTNQLHLVSLMRALYVKIPGHGYSMLNAAFSWGGAKLLVQTVEENFRVDIHDYMIINFNGFTNAIDTIGGVTINLTEAEVNYLLRSYPTSGLVAGSSQLNGTLTLAYARIRKIDSDFSRTGRQRTVINALVTKAASMNVGELDAFARQMLPLIKTDLSGSAMVGLAVDGLTYSRYPLSQLMLPVSKSSTMIYVRGAEMYKWDVEKNVTKLQSLLYG